MSDFVIEKGVPAPEARYRNKYPFGEMEVGDSFFVPGGEAGKLSNSASVYARYHGRKLKFSARKVEGGARVWRVA